MNMIHYISSLFSNNTLPKNESKFLNNLLPKDLLSLCLSYLTDDEFFYVYGPWTKISKLQVYSIATENGWTDLFKWVIKNQYQDIPYDDNVYKYAAENGHLEILKLIHIQYNKQYNKWFSSWIWNENDICIYAAKGGHTHILEWMLKLNKNIKWNSMMTTAAAKNNHFGTLKWLAANGCDMDSWVNNYMYEH